jgi:hypothetical protein
MDREENTPLPEDPPVTIGDEEIDRLLSEAEILADDIVTTIGGDSTTPIQDQATDPAVEQMPDPLEAEQATERNLADLQDLVAHPSEGKQAQQQPADTAQADAPPETTAEPETAPDQPGVKNTEADDGPARGEAVEPDARSDKGPDTAEGKTGEEGEDPESDASKPEPVPRVLSFRKRLAATGKILLRATTSAPRALLGILVLIDRPFSGLPRPAKRFIGFFAIITILMGITSLLLPELLDRNPYVEIHD